MTVQTQAESAIVGYAPVRFLWLEITGKGQLACEHCYADSGPTGTHGSMSRADWERTIDEAAELGVKMVQFIGGEPTLHPDLAVLVKHALDCDLEVEVFSNLMHVSASLWEVFAHPGVRLATSYYSDVPVEHELITGRRGSFRRTLDGMTEALRRDIPLRVGMVGLKADQRVDEACRHLAQLGVTDMKVDLLRHVGRGNQSNQDPAIDELCGNCADGVLAVSPSGLVWPCVFARQFDVGDVRHSGLATVVKGERFRKCRQRLGDAFAVRRQAAGPSICNPHYDSPPCIPKNCNPQARVVPTALGPDHGSVAGK